MKVRVEEVTIKEFPFEVRERPKYLTMKDLEKAYKVVRHHLPPYQVVSKWKWWLYKMCFWRYFEKYPGILVDKKYKKVK